MPAVLTDIIAFYSLDETAYIRVDSSGNIHISGTGGTSTIELPADFYWDDDVESHYGESQDASIQYAGTGNNWIFDNKNTAGSTLFDLGTDTSDTDFQIRNNTGTALFTVNGAGTITLPGPLDINNTIDMDVALTATGDAFNLLATMNHATQVAEALDVTVQQITNARTAGTLTAVKATVISLAGSSAGVDHYAFEAAVTAGEATADHFALKVGAGFDYLMDVSACATGEADILLKANSAEAMSWTDSVGTVMSIDTTTGACALDLNALLDLDYALTGTGDLANITGTMSHATQTAEGLDVSIAQLTNARTAGELIAIKATVTSLAGSTAGTDHICYDAQMTAGEATADHIGFRLGAGFDYLMDLSACATGEADVLLAANKAEALSFTDSVATVMAIVTTTGAVGLNLDGFLDLDHALTGTGDLCNIAGTMSHATQTAEGLDVSIAQLTNVRTAGELIAVKATVTSLAGSTAGTDHYCFDAQMVAGEATADHFGFRLGAGFDYLMDLSGCASGEPDILLAANLAEAMSWTDSVGTVMAVVTTTGAVGLDLNGVLDLDYTATSATEFAGIAGVINHATANATSLGVTCIQNTTARTAGTVVGISSSVTSLAGDLNNVEYVDLSLGLTDGGGSVVHIGIDFADGFDRVMDFSAVSTGAADIYLGSNLAEALSFTDSVGTVMAVVTTTGAVGLDLNGVLDLDYAFTGTGTLADIAGTINHATQVGQGLAVSMAQLSTNRTAGNVTGIRSSVTSLAGDTAGVDYYAYEAAVTVGEAGADHHAIKIGAGFDAVLDLLSCATGEADVLLADNLASAFQVREAANLYQTFVTTNNAERVRFDKQINAVLGMDHSRVEEVEDFLLAASGTLPNPWAKDMQTANITGDYLAGAAYGAYRIASDGTSEAQAGQLTMGDFLPINLSNNPIIEFRVRIAPAGAAFTADERLAIGLGTAHANAEDGLDAVSVNCWFRIEGASLAWVVEVDDGGVSVDSDDIAHGVTCVKSAWTTLRIDASDLSDVQFYVDGVASTGATMDLSNVAGNTYVQPIICMQRDADSEVNTLDVDYVAMIIDR